MILGFNDNLAFETLNNSLEGKVKCEACHALYNYSDEPKEVQEGGVHICPECWSLSI